MRGVTRRLVGEFVGAQLFYRVRPMSGRRAVLGAEVPSVLAIPAAPAQPGWRQCSNCCDAWEACEDVAFARCPSCGELTELEPRAADE